MPKYIASYIVSIEVEAPDTDEALDLAIEEFEYGVDGQWHIQEQQED